MRINLKKIQFAQNEVEILGFKIDGHDIIPMEKQKQKILEFLIPTKIKECRQFLGMCNWFRSFIKDMALKTKEMTNSLRIKKDAAWSWNSKMNKEFEDLKNEIKQCKDLKIPNYNKEFVLRTDASNFGLGAVLMQRNNNNELKPIEWASKKLTDTEKRYGISEKEMYAAFWGIKKFEYELKGRKFVLETDHKALERLRDKPYFDNNRINRWSEKIMEFDFEVRYVKGESMGKADELSRGIDVNSKIKTERGIKIANSKFKKHVEKIDDCEFWKFDNGIIRKMPPVDERKKLCIMYHEDLLHRSYEAVYQEMKKKFYWPGIKATIIHCIKACEVCQMYNRKKRNAPEFVETIKPFEKVALDIMFLEEKDKYLLVGIDYFTRIITIGILSDKKSQSVCEELKSWFKEGYIPEEIITDNGREFVNSNVKTMFAQIGIKHRKTGIEDHRSNGRIERAIGTIREYMQKIQNDDLEEKIKMIVTKYNNTVHSALKKSPNEALLDYEDIELQARNRYNVKIKGKVKKNANTEDNYIKGEKVRICQKENINKYERGRFLETGVVIEKCENKSYLIRLNKNGKIVKKRNHDIKKILVDCELTAQGGDVEPQLS